MSTVGPEMRALQRLYHREKTAPRRIALTQPMGGGVTKDLTWAEMVDRVRRMTTHLMSQGVHHKLPPGSAVAILSKNCAWWLMSDLAIWMAGYVSAPLYPTLAADTVRQIVTHSEARACFVGKLDGSEGMSRACPPGCHASAARCHRRMQSSHAKAGTRSAHAPRRCWVRGPAAPMNSPR